MRERIRQQRKQVGTWLDRAIQWVAPEWGARRLAMRTTWQRWAQLDERFARIEAAQHDETRGSRWLISRLSPDSQLEQDLETTRERSRDIYQNDAMGGAIEGKVNHVIGTGHTPQSRVKAKEGILSDAEAERVNTQLEQLYGDWNQQADRGGRKSVWMLSRLAERHNEFDGESFTVLSDVGRADKPIPLSIQVIDPERVNTPPRYAADPSVRLGIRYAATGEIAGYYVQRSHPGDTKEFSLEYDLIPEDRMLHVFEPWFAEQSRGLPWMTRALNRAKDAKDYDEAAILGAQIEQCFAGFVKPAMASGFQSAYGASSGTAASGDRMQDITPGTITHLDPGEEIDFATPTRPGNTFAPFMEWNYRRVAAALNWPYEMVVKRWDGLSFAAGRLVLTDAKKATEVGQQIMREQWLSRIWHRMVDEAVMLGEVEINPSLYIAEPYTFRRHVWIAPKWEYALNPGEEVTADINEIDANLSTLEDKLGKRGYDLEELIQRRQRENRLLKEAGLSSPTPAGRQPPPGPQATPSPAEDDQQEDGQPDTEDQTDDETTPQEAPA